MQKILFVFGTRPEAIKLAPLIKTFSNNPNFSVKICVTGQHREMLDQVLKFFEIIPDYDLQLMQANQSLFQVIANGLLKLEKVLEETQPDLIFVQGDTTTVLLGALAAALKKIKVAHIEAGLRSHNKLSPFPEEINRVVTSDLSNYHFVPTPKARENLLLEGINESIYIVGNTVIDALHLGLSIVEKDNEKYQSFFSAIDFSKKLILVTCHRRESFGAPFQEICRALQEIATRFPDVELVYPVHLNPNIHVIAHEYLSDVPNIKLIPPLEYPNLIWLMNKSYLVLTDSGGIQEEAPSLGKPVLVLREVTERQEGVEAGTAKLVGTNQEKIVSEVSRLLLDKNHYKQMATATNPYGNGTSCEEILEILIKELVKSSLHI